MYSSNVSTDNDLLILFHYVMLYTQFVKFQSFASYSASVCQPLLRLGVLRPVVLRRGDLLVPRLVASAAKKPLPAVSLLRVVVSVLGVPLPLVVLGVPRLVVSVLGVPRLVVSVLGVPRLVASAARKPLPAVSVLRVVLSVLGVPRVEVSVLGVPRLEVSVRGVPRLEVSVRGVPRLDVSVK